MSSGLLHWLHAMSMAVAWVAGVACGYAAFRANGDLELAVWKGLAVMIVVMIAGRAGLWLAQPWESKPMPGTVITPGEAEGNGQR
jgi:hypothetical protein